MADRALLCTLDREINRHCLNASNKRTIPVVKKIDLTVALEAPNVRNTISKPIALQFI